MRGLVFLDALVTDGHIIDIDMVVVGGGPAAAVVKIDPNGFNFQRFNIAHSHVGFLENEFTINPATQDAVILSRCVQACVLLDTVPAVVFKA